jgi:hypothetical protein
MGLRYLHQLTRLRLRGAIPHFIKQRDTASTHYESMQRRLQCLNIGPASRNTTYSGDLTTSCLTVVMTLTVPCRTTACQQHDAYTSEARKPFGCSLVCFQHNARHTTHRMCCTPTLQGPNTNRTSIGVLLSARLARHRVIILVFRRGSQNRDVPSHPSTTEQRRASRYVQIVRFHGNISNVEILYAAPDATTQNVSYCAAILYCERELVSMTPAKTANN